MKYTQELCPILRKEQLNATTFSFLVKSETAVATMRCGQFANLLADGKTLRRPISVCDFDRTEGWIRFVFEVRGEGTGILSRKSEGDSLDILAPLGNGFPVIDSSYEELKACELIPFKAAIDAGADMVMTAHIQYPQIETETYTSVSTGEQVFLPATMSRKILTGRHCEIYD